MMSLHSEGRFAPPFVDRRERFVGWARSTFRYGAKEYAGRMGVDLRTAEGRFEGRYPPPDEEDRLIEMFGDEYLGAVIHPALVKYIERKEAEARENLARIATARARLARAHHDDTGRDDGDPRMDL